MKKALYPFSFLLLALLIMPVSCATQSAAEKPEPVLEQQEHAQNGAAVQEELHEESAGQNQQDTGFQNGNAQPAAESAQRKQVTPDAVSGATTDAVSGATLSRRDARGQIDPQGRQSGAGKDQNRKQQSVEPDMPAVEIAVEEENYTAAVPKSAGEIAAPESTGEMPHTAVPENAEAMPGTAAAARSLVAVIEKSSEPSVQAVSESTAGSADASPVSQSVPESTARTEVQEEPKTVEGAAAETSPEQVAVGESRAVQPDSAEVSPVAQSAPESITLAELPKDVNPEEDRGAAASSEQQVAAADEEMQQSLVSAETAQPVVQTYEDTLADLISDFEEQGGSHGYVPPPTFHEEMLDLFSPRIFTVALSKEPETEQKVKVSRMVAVEEKQRLELTYPGHGWVYVGEQTAQQGLKYEQRKLQDNTSVFMFTADKKGDYVLHFSYFDVFTNDFITDAVAVSVSPARSTAAKSMVRAPDYKSSPESDSSEQQPNTQTAAGAADSDSGTGADSVVQAANAAVTSADPAAADEVSALNTAGLTASAAGVSGTEEILSPDQLLEKARTAIGTADAGSALQYLEQFFAAATRNLDEGWFLQGRAYELNGSQRNIRRALAAYKTLTDAYPQSKYWAESDARIRYITSFYINIQ